MVYPLEHLSPLGHTQALVRQPGDRRPVLALLLAGVLAGPVLAQAPAGASSPPAAPLTPPVTAPALRGARAPIGCLISPDRVADIGTPVVGIVASLAVDVGDRVRSGQTLALLRSDVEGASVQAAQARSSIDADVQAAEANLVLARQRLDRAQELQSQGFVSGQATDQARAEHQVALQRVEQAKGQRRVSMGELGVARAQLGQRRVPATFDGVVIERYVNAGERVEDKPLLRVARLDPLRVDLVVPAGRYGSVALKDRLSIAPELPGAAPVLASVTHIDPVIDAASNTFRVRLSLPNPDHHLPGGARCRVELPADPHLARDVPAAGPGLPPAGSGAAARPSGADPVANRPGVVPAVQAVTPTPRAPVRAGLALKLTL